jgi:transcription elongation factor Elf1
MHQPHAPQRFQGWGTQLSTTVACPVCRDRELELRTTCVSTVLWCGRCGRFELARLFELLAPSDFETVAGLVEHRLSDRV